MRKLLPILVLLALSFAFLSPAWGENQSGDANDSGNETANQTGIQLPDVNLTELGEKAKNATRTGVGPLDDVAGFLADASPFLLLIIGILLIVLSGFGKLIGIILVILALIRLVWMMFF